VSIKNHLRDILSLSMRSLVTVGDGKSTMALLITRFPRRCKGPSKFVPSSRSYGGSSKSPSQGSVLFVLWWIPTVLCGAWGYWQACGYGTNQCCWRRMVDVVLISREQVAFHVVFDSVAMWCDWLVAEKPTGRECL